MSAQQIVTVQEWRKMQGVKLPPFWKHDNGVIEIDLTPVGKPRQTQRDKWDKRACVMRYRAFADQLRAVAKMCEYELTDELYAIFYLPMAKSWSKKKQAEKLGTRHDQKPDIDNMCKSVMDSLCKEDKKIYRAWADKYWSESGRPGKVVLYPNKSFFLSHLKF